MVIPWGTRRPRAEPGNFLDLPRLAIDYRSAPPPWPSAHHWNVLIKFPSLRTPLTLLEAAGGIRGAVIAVEFELAYNRMTGGVDERDEGWDSAGLAIMIT